MTSGSSGGGASVSTGRARRCRQSKISPFTSTTILRGSVRVKISVLSSSIVGSIPYDSGRIRAVLIVPLVYLTHTSTEPEKSKYASDDFRIWPEPVVALICLRLTEYVATGVHGPAAVRTFTSKVVACAIPSGIG